MARPRGNRSAADIVLSRIERRENGCWEWQGPRNNCGYGQVWVMVGNKQRGLLVHRVMWEHAHGAIPHGLLVCHTCDNRRCCNPEHMFLGTSKDNSQDMVKKNRHISERRKITFEMAQAIRTLADKFPQRELAERFGVGRQSISLILSGKIYRV